MAKKKPRSLFSARYQIDINIDESLADCNGSDEFIEKSLSITVVHSDRDPSSSRKQNVKELNAICEYFHEYFRDRIGSLYASMFQEKKANETQESRFAAGRWSQVLDEITKASPRRGRIKLKEANRVAWRTEKDEFTVKCAEISRNYAGEENEKAVVSYVSKQIFGQDKNRKQKLVRKLKKFELTTDFLVGLVSERW
jgi:hypothetical protein